MGNKNVIFWIEDVINVMLWCFDHPNINELFNLGTGIARGYYDLAKIVCKAADITPNIQFVSMPGKFIGRYQSFTQADMTSLRKAGYIKEFSSLENGIEKYIKSYLKKKGRDRYL